MLTSASDAERSVRWKKAHDERFIQWLGEPTTKLLTSLIPSSENPDALKTVLRSAFDSGVGSGQSEILIELMGSMMKDRS